MEPPTSNRKIESLSAPWTWQIHSKAPRQSEPAISGHFLHRCSARKWKATWNTNKQRWGFSNHRTFFCLDTFPFGKKPTWSKCDALKKTNHETQKTTLDQLGGSKNAETTQKNAIKNPWRSMASPRISTSVLAWWGHLNRPGWERPGRFWRSDMRSASLISGKVYREKGQQATNP